MFNCYKRRKSKTRKESKAILAGINYRQSHKSMQLNGCVNDALNMRTMLLEQYNFRKQDITLLVDEEHQASQGFPTKDAILSSLKDTVAKSRQLESIWFHYSGHGASMKDTSGDELDGKDEYLIPCDVYQNGIILDDEMFEILNEAKCPVFLTIDCCHSGSACDLTYSFSIVNNEFINRRVEHRQKMKNMNIHMLSGCQDDQTSADAEFVNPDGKGTTAEGAFTKGLIEALKARNYNVSLFQLFRDVTDFLTQCEFPQRTVFSSSNPFPRMSLQKK